MRCAKAWVKVLLSMILTVSLLFSNVSFSYAAGSSISVKLNPVSISINGKAVKIDSFEYAGKYYIQLKDICSYLGIEYSFSSQNRTVAAYDRKPKNAVAPSKPVYSTYTASTVKALAVKISPYIIKINNKTVKLQHYVVGSNIYFAANDLASNLSRDYRVDTEAKVLYITDKKPPVPVLKASVATITDKDVSVTIENWGNAVKKEYKIDDGPWKPYTKPVAVPNNGFVFARGTNAANIESDIAKLEIRNIRKTLNKVDVSKLSKWAVKIIAYDANDEAIGSGSGFIVSPDGKIATNYHVIDMKPHIQVVTYDDQVYDVIGVTAFDASRDIAILKINATDLPWAILGDSGNLKLGEEVVTFGYPLGEGLSVTFGNISSVNATPGMYRDGGNDIQISAPISHGSSGGPLLNMMGEVLGINYATNINGQNMNYAIPINELQPLLASNTITSLEKLISQVYPVMSPSQYEYYLYCNYPSKTIDGYEFSFYNDFLTGSSDYPNDLYIELNLNMMQYAEVLMAELEGDRAAVEAWAEGFYKDAKSRFPNKDIYVVVIFSGSFRVSPTGYTSQEIGYNSETGMYDVFKVKLLYGYENGQVYKRWSN